MGQPRAAEIVDRTWLLDEAGEVVFARGLSYWEEGRVRIARADKSGVSGVVRGSRTYSVEIRIGRGARTGAACTCPAFEREAMCKHVVALGLAANAAAEPGAELSELDRISAYLGTLEADRLRSVLLEWVLRDADLRDHLLLNAFLSTANDEELSRVLVQAAEQAITIDEYASYGMVGDWVSALQDVIDSIESAFGAGRAASVLAPLQALFDGMDEALLSMDDPNGEGEALFLRAQRLHIEACKMTKPDPVELAQELFKLEVDGEFDLFADAAAAYSASLGKRGRAEIRRLARAAWAEVKPAKPHRRGGFDAVSVRNQRLGRMMEGLTPLAETDARISIRSKLLQSSHDYAELAKFCREAGRLEEALKWADEGSWVFDDEPASLLVTLTADLRHELGDQAGAMDLLWSAFKRHPHPHLHQKIVGLTPAGEARRAAEQTAIDHLRTRVSAKGKSHHERAEDVVLLLEILIGAGRLSEAWNAYHETPIDRPIVNQLLEASEMRFPDNTLAVLVQRVEADVKSGTRYQQAVEGVRRVGAIRSRLKRQDDQRTWIAHLRHLHKAKRNFIKALDKTGQ